MAILGVIGVVVGQLVNAWREDRRWSREVAREDLRWKREQERLQAEREHELKAYWRNERLRLYSSFSGLAQSWANLLQDAIDDLQKDALSEETLARLQELHKRVRDSFDEIILLGSPKTTDACWLFLTEHELALRFVEGESLKVNRQHLDGVCDQVLDTLRVELGIEPHNLPALLKKWDLLPPA